MKWNEIIEASGKNKTKPKIKTKRWNNEAVKERIKNKAMNQWITESWLTENVNSNWTNWRMNDWLNERITEWLNASLHPWLTEWLNATSTLSHPFFCEVTPLKLLLDASSLSSLICNSNLFAQLSLQCVDEPPAAARHSSVAHKFTAGLSPSTFLGMFSADRALATVSCAFFRPRLPRVARSCAENHMFEQNRSSHYSLISALFFNSISRSKPAPVETQTSLGDPWSHHACKLTGSHTSILSRKCTCSWTTTVIYCFHFATTVATSVVDMKMWKLTIDICPELGSLLTKFRLMKLICLGYFDRTRYRLSRCSSTVQYSMSQEYETAQPCDLLWPSETVQFIAQKIEISERPATCWILGPALILSMVQEERNGTSESLCKCESTGPVYRSTISLQTKRLQKSSRKGWPIFHLPAIWTIWLRTSDCKEPGLKKHVPCISKGMSVRRCIVLPTGSLIYALAFGNGILARNPAHIWACPKMGDVPNPLIFLCFQSF